MTIQQWHKTATTDLQIKGIESASLDSWLLLEAVIQKDRSWLIGHSETILNPEQQKLLDNALEKRLRRIPLAYICKNAWFYGREFYVDEHVLIPRPESEDMISLAIELGTKPRQAADIGTGSGCLAITLALEFPDISVSAVDVDPGALSVARKNSYSHQVKISFIESYLLDDVNASTDLILANLPYVPEGLITSPEIKTEPEIALFSGEKGLDLYQSFWAQVGSKFNARPGPLIITESLLTQHNDMVALAASANFHLVKTLGLAQAWKRG